MANNNKIKVQVMLSKEIVERIDKYADSIGTSRSGVCGQFIAQGINNYELAQKMLSQFTEGMNDEMKNMLVEKLKGGE